MPEVNLLAVLVAALAAFIVGGLWYGPLFGKRWQREAEIGDEQLKQVSPAKVFGLTLVLALIAAYVFAVHLGPQPGLAFAAGRGFVVGVFFVATAFAINYLFAQRSLPLFLIDAGYNVLFFTAIGTVLGVWP